jgi:hypothetical protein
LPDPQYRGVLRRLGLDYFAKVENLNLLDAASFLSLFPAGRRNNLITGGLPLLPSNLLCLSREAEEGIGAARPRALNVAEEGL